MQIETVSGLWHCLEILKTQKSTSGGILCIFGSHTFVPISWMCKKQTSVSHSPTESKIISLDARICAWMDFPLLIFGIWLLKCCSLLSTNLKKSQENVHGHLLHDTPSRKYTKNQIGTPTHYNYLELCNVDYVSSNVKSSQFGAMLYSIEDDEAVIKMIIKGRSPTMRHVSRTHRVSLDWSFDRMNLELKNPKPNMLTPKTNSQTYWQIAISHVMGGKIFSICSISAFSAQQAAPKRCRKECTKEQEKRQLWRSRTRRWTWSRILRQTLPQRRVRVHPVHKLQGNLPLEVQINMTQREVLKCG